MKIPSIPQGPLSSDVEFKALASLALSQSTSPEGTIGEAIIAPQYAPVQHETWAKLCLRQSALLADRVCPEYLEGRQKMSFPMERVPDLAYASKQLKKQTQWQVIRVNGYVPEPIFFKLLANKCFPCTDFLRHPDELEYTPAPDMFHDLMGHLPMITNPQFAAFFHDFGMAGLNAKTDEDIAMLGRIYWFTVEFGLINPTVTSRRDDSQTRIYGAGLSSSVGEIVHSLSAEVAKDPFDIELVAQTTFDIHHMQPRLFVIESFENLELQFRDWAKKRNLLS